MIILRTKQFGPALGPGFGPVVKPTGGLGMNSIARPKTSIPPSKPIGGWGNPKNTPSPQMQQKMEQLKAKLVASQQKLQQKLAQRPQPIQVQGSTLSGARPQAAGAPSQPTTVPFRAGM